MSLTQVPLHDPSALEGWILQHRTAVTPVVLERFLTYNWYADYGDVPTHGRARCAVWKPKIVDQCPELDAFQIWVYYTDTVTSINLDAAFRAVALFKQWQMKTGIILSESSQHSRTP
jgi:hypothetical protein